MRGILIFILLLGTISTSVQGQSKQQSTQAFGLSASASIFEYSVRGYLEPYMAWGTDRKQLLVAPTLLLGTNLGYQTPRSPRLTGLRFGYQLWPGSFDHKWNFYISTDLRLQRLKDQWAANYFNVSLSDYQEFNIKTVELSLENYVGYGLVLKISDHFRITQGVGLGWYLSNLDARSPKANTHIVDKVDYRGYDNLGFLWNVSFRVVYVIGN